MTTKQKFKILSLLFTILSVVSLFVPNLKDSKQNYSTFDLVHYNGFKFFILLIIIFSIVALAFNLMSISYDKNKYLPIVTLISSFICAIIMIFIKRISAPNGAFGREIWLEDTSVQFGTYLLIISSFISFITNTCITIRSFVLGKNDDDYVVEVKPKEEKEENLWNPDEEMDEELDDSNEENELEDSEMKENLELLDEFKEKE